MQLCIHQTICSRLECSKFHIFTLIDRDSQDSSISQTTSWSTLKISRSTLETILKAHNIMPEFSLIASFFREKTRLEDMAHCAPFVERRGKDIYGRSIEFMIAETMS